MNHPSETALGAIPCTVCEPSWLAGACADARMRAHWQALPRTSLVAGESLGAGCASAAAIWVEDGLLATVFSDAHGRERVHHFHPAAHWLAPPQLPTRAWRLEAQVPSCVVLLDRQQLELAKALDPRVTEWMLQALMAERQRLTLREHQWLMLSATERYQCVLEQTPAWLYQVPQHRLASYLGLTHVALSRIRRRLRESAAK
jgi:CRP-like cAMP-binding protein